MTELKTLKDLEKQEWSTHKEDMGLVRAVFFDLKQLIIDHIKYMRREGREFYNANIDEKSAIPKLMHIFNLNEEDLKDGKRES